MKVRVKFRKYGIMKFLGHLDLLRFFQKAMRRADIPIAFSGGYSPHMIMSFAHPLGVGLTSEGEYFDIELTEPISSREAVERLNLVMVDGTEVVSFVEIQEDKRSAGMAIVAAADYRCIKQSGTLPQNSSELAKRFFTQTEIPILKQTKRSEQMIDIKPMIYHFRSEEDGFFTTLATGSAQNLKPGLVMEAFMQYAGLSEDDVSFRYHRLETYARDAEQNLIPLDQLGTEII
ncbi:MAG: TIGR03936 family radical SAM-associated protein [Lachnospiraceae bacterium]